MEIITNPWKERLLELISNSKKNIRITSPLVKENICDEIILAKNKNSSIELITSFKLMNIYSGSVDIRGLEKIIKTNGIVKNFTKLHAKIYIFDDKEVVITSSNLTNGGLINNYEYGIYSKDKKIVEKTLLEFNQISKNENVGNIKLKDIHAVQNILSNIPKSKNIILPKYEIETDENQFDVIEIENNIITSTLRGWKLEVFKCVDELPSMIFTLNEMKKYEKHLQLLYPNNKNILAKIRQQLQLLRDYGLIEFLGNGKYRKLWKNK